MYPAMAPSLRIGLETGLDATSFFVLHLVNRPLCVCVSCSVSVPLLATPWSPSGFFVHGILQARILEWVATPSSRGSSRPRDRTWVSMSPALAGRFFTTSATWEAHTLCTYPKRALWPQEEQDGLCSPWRSKHPQNSLYIMFSLVIRQSNIRK